MSLYKTITVAALSIVAAVSSQGCVGCGGDDAGFIECRDDTSCGLREGGDCLVNAATGNQFCAYPDAECTGTGMRWSDLDVESSISGMCVSEAAPIDAGIDANDFDAMPPDGGTPESDFARRYGDFGYDEIVALDVGTSGFAFGGAFRDDVDFGGGLIDGDATGDMVIANYATNGAFAWVRTFGATNPDTVADVAMGSGGDVFFCGTWGSTVDFGEGPVEPGNTIGISGDIALGKLAASNGAPVWPVRTLRNAFLKSCGGVAVDAGGDLFVVGGFRDVVDFGNGNVTAADSQMYVAKYDGDNGALIWVRQLGGTGNEAALRVTVASNGDPIVVGRFTGTANFGGGNMTSVGGSFDSVAIRLASADGAYVWASTIGSPVQDEALAVFVDGAGDIYVGGMFSGTIELGAQDLASNGDKDGFLMKLAGSTGLRQWIIGLGGPNTDQVQAVTVGSDGNPVVTGFFTGSADFGNGTVTSGGVADAFIAAYAPTNGAFQSARRIGGVGNDKALAVAPGGDMNLYVAGSFIGTVDFGVSVLVAPGAAGGQPDMFIMRYHP